ncbi:MAG: hypothetical protein F6K14_33210 [Symploca sp. SIO2C1]|nr:hypothetical protein [Symploca sp. SIO2C1]
MIESPVWYSFHTYTASPIYTHPIPNSRFPIPDSQFPIKKAVLQISRTVKTKN